MMPAAPFTFGPHRLVSLLLTPRAYFSHPDALRDRRGILLAAALSGIAGAMDRIDQKLIKSDLRHQELGGGDSFLSWVLESWMHYWVIVLCSGLVGAVLVWFVRGWWYRKRLEWSGAGEVEPMDARSINALQDLVYVLPAVALALIQTVCYTNYAEAWEANDIIGMVVVVFLFWSCWTSYCAATTVFTLQKNKARVWFLILPMILYALMLGAMTALFAIIS